jgi:autotransporter passenger strand-loop-strand repeat protein
MTTVSSGTLAVSSGQTSDGVIVLSGGQLNVLSGGTILNTFNSGGDELISGGSSVSAIISAFAVQDIFSGGIASGASIFGTDTLQGVQYIDSAGTAVGTILNNGGAEDVFSGGTASATLVNSGGELDVESGGWSSASRSTVAAPISCPLAAQRSARRSAMAATSSSPGVAASAPL